MSKLGKNSSSHFVGVLFENGLLRENIFTRVFFLPGLREPRVLDSSFLTTLVANTRSLQISMILNTKLFFYTKVTAAKLNLKVRRSNKQRIANMWISQIHTVFFFVFIFMNRICLLQVRWIWGVFADFFFFLCVSTSSFTIKIVFYLC